MRGGVVAARQAHNLKVSSSNLLPAIFNNMAKKYKILIASILAGSGHNSAGDLLEEVLGKNENWEIVRFVHPSKTIDKTYNDMTERSPLVHNFFVSHSPIITGDALSLSMIHLADECVDIINKEKPDCIISTHTFLAMWFKIAQWVTKRPFIMMNACLDYGDQPSAMFPYNIFIRSDYSIAFSQKARDSIIKKTKQNPDYVWMAGHRPKKDFLNYKIISKEKAKVQLKEYFTDPNYNQISKDKISILIAGGGGGTIQKTKDFLKKISRFQKKKISLLDKYQFFVICGQNEQYQKNILKMRRTKLSWQNIIPFGWLTSNEYALVQRASDFPILYGIAPATMHELMYSETLPLIIHKLRAAHEAGNAEFVEKMKFGYFIKKDSELIEAIFSNKFIRDKEKYKKRAHALLAEEEERLNKLEVKLYDCLRRDKPSIYKIYKVDFLNKIVSTGFTGIVLFAYYLRKLIYKILGPFNFWEKRERI